MKIYSWNVNGIRAVLNKGALQSLIQKHDPDILCLQEIKAFPEQVPESNEIDKYKKFWYSAEKAGYSGTAILSKTEPIKVINGLPEDIIKKYKVTGDLYGDPNLEGRVLTAEFAKFFLVTVYTPNVKDDLSRLNVRYKHWDPSFLVYVRRLEKTKPVIFCGDINVAHTEEDLANPKTNVGKKGFTDEERAGFQAFIDAGFIDTFRQLHKGNGFYTWWSYFANARSRNVGWRIDYFLMSKKLLPKLKQANIYPEVMGSDHCPTSVTLDL